MYIYNSKNGKTVSKELNKNSEQQIKSKYKNHVENFIKTSNVSFAFSAHQEVILIQIEYP